MPCEIQELPNLHAPGGQATSFPPTAPATSGRQPLSASRAEARPEAFVAKARTLKRTLERVYERRGAER